MKRAFTSSRAFRALSKRKSLFASRALFKYSPSQPRRSHFTLAMVAMSTAEHVALARLARVSARRTRAAPCRAARVVASASRSPDAPVGEVTRAVLAFHEGDRAGLGSDDAVVPLASWAKRFGWDAATAERVLWECDVPAKGALSVADDDSSLPSSHFSKKDTRVVDAADARVGLWVTHVFPDFVVRALLAASGSDTGGALSKRQALDAARAALEKEHPKVALSFAGAAARAAFFTKNTNGAFADVLRSLRRRYASDEDAPFCVLTRKGKKQRMYTCVLRGEAPPRVEPRDGRTGGGGGGASETDGWEAVFGVVSFADAEKNADADEKATPSADAAAAMRARREARRGTMRLAAVKRDGAGVSDITAKDAARRARAEGW